MINLNLKYNNDDKRKVKKQLEINRIGNKNCWIKKMAFQQRMLIYHVPAKRFINPGGPPFFLSCIFFLAEGVD